MSGGDGGQWLRQQCLVLAQVNHTPVPYWLSLPLSQFGGWIRDSNNIQKSIRAEIDRRRKR